MSLEDTESWLCVAGLDLISAEKKEQQVRDQDQDREPRGFLQPLGGFA